PRAATHSSCRRRRSASTATPTSRARWTTGRRAFALSSPACPASSSVESQRGLPRVFSFEFFPPKTPEGVAKLHATRKQLAQLDPAFFSVTYGAGGSTREGTLATVLEIRKAGSPAAPHLSCIASTRENLREVIKQYKANDIKHIVALRGDLPS